MSGHNSPKRILRFRFGRRPSAAKYDGEVTAPVGVVTPRRGDYAASESVVQMTDSNHAGLNYRGRISARDSNIEPNGDGKEQMPLIIDEHFSWLA